MRNGIELSAEEKKAYCDRLTAVLVELRKRLGQTQEEMESTSGISRVTLSQIESGRSRMSCTPVLLPGKFPWTEEPGGL